jgi:nitric oxide dioxygenase
MKEPSMTPEQITAIQESFAKVAPISEQAAALFYGRLFEIDPALKPLFHGDMKEQGRKLMATLAVVVNNLNNLGAVLPAASALAKRHVAYGVKPAHYTPVGEALLWTLRQGLGAAWTPELAAAWSAAYGVLSEFMIAEAYGRSAAAE